MYFVLIPIHAALGLPVVVRVYRLSRKLEAALDAARAKENLGFGCGVLFDNTTSRVIGATLEAYGASREDIMDVVVPTPDGEGDWIVPTAEDWRPKIFTSEPGGDLSFGHFDLLRDKTSLVSQGDPPRAVPPSKDDSIDPTKRGVQITLEIGGDDLVTLKNVRVLFPIKKEKAKLEVGFGGQTDDGRSGDSALDLRWRDELRTDEEEAAYQALRGSLLQDFQVPSTVPPAGGTQPQGGTTPEESEGGLRNPEPTGGQSEGDPSPAPANQEGGEGGTPRGEGDAPRRDGDTPRGDGSEPNGNEGGEPRGDGDPNNQDSNNQDNQDDEENDRETPASEPEPPPAKSKDAWPADPLDTGGSDMTPEQAQALWEKIARFFPSVTDPDPNSDSALPYLGFLSEDEMAALLGPWAGGLDPYILKSPDDVDTGDRQPTLSILTRNDLVRDPPREVDHQQTADLWATASVGSGRVARIAVDTAIAGALLQNIAAVALELEMLPRVDRAKKG